MSIKVMTAVWEYAPVEGGKLLVLLALADHANDNGLCWPSIRSLARKSRLTERHVQRVLRELERDALVLTDMGMGPFGANMYRVVFSRGDKMSGVLSEAEGVTSETAGGDTGVTQTVK